MQAASHFGKTSTRRSKVHDPNDGSGSEPDIQVRFAAVRQETALLGRMAATGRERTFAGPALQAFAFAQVVAVDAGAAHRRLPVIPRDAGAGERR